MNIDQLQALLNRLKAAGVPGTTPVVVAHGDEDENDVSLTELDDQCVLENVQYNISSEKMAVIRRNGNVVVLSSADCPAYQNTDAFKETQGADVIYHEINPHPKEGVDVTHLCGFGETIDMNDVVRVPADIWTRTKLSADRWCALLSAPAIRILGSSGIIKPSSNPDYAHFGMEIWTHHTGEYDNGHAGSVLTTFADKMYNNKRNQQSKLIVNIESALIPNRVPSSGRFVGANIDISIPPTMLSDLLTIHFDSGTITQESAKKIAIRLGISTPVGLVVDYDDTPVELDIDFDGFYSDDRIVIGGVFSQDGRSVEIDQDVVIALEVHGDAINDQERAALKGLAKSLGFSGNVSLKPIFHNED